MKNHILQYFSFIIKKNLQVPVYQTNHSEVHQMHNHCINKLLNIEDVIVKNIIQADSYVKIVLETKPKKHICPICGRITKRIHDYRMQTIKDLPLQLKHCYLVLRKRRYACSCGKRFYENYCFLNVIINLHIKQSQSIF